MKTEEKIGIYENLTEVVMELTHSSGELVTAIQLGYQTRKEFETELDIFHKGLQQKFGEVEGTITNMSQQIRNSFEGAAQEGLKAISGTSRTAENSISKLNQVWPFFDMGAMLSDRRYRASMDPK